LKRPSQVCSKKAGCPAGQPPSRNHPAAIIVSAMPRRALISLIQPNHASNQAGDCKSQNNQKFHRIPSLVAKKITIGFKLSHGSECSASRQKKSSNCRG
jgi:hypothetical protein